MGNMDAHFVLMKVRPFLETHPIAFSLLLDLTVHINQYLRMPGGLSVTVLQYVLLTIIRKQVKCKSLLSVSYLLGKRYCGCEYLVPPPTLWPSVRVCRGQTTCLIYLGSYTASPASYGYQELRKRDFSPYASPEDVVTKNYRKRDFSPYVRVLLHCSYTSI